jgi:AraC-like DNA-binding protein
MPLWKSLGSTRSIEEWAVLVGYESERLRRELRGLGVRCPRRLLTWLRLLSAWPRLRAGTAAGSVALEVGYSAPPDFSRCARRFVGLPPSSAGSVPLDDLIARAVADLVA